MKVGHEALVVLSGGQDSTICLFWAKKNFDKVRAITFDYGQRHKIEIQAARKVWDQAFELDGLEFINLPPTILSSTSPLVNIFEPLETYDNYEKMQKVIGNRVELTFVPMRNALFLTIAANRARAKGIRNIVTGVCHADGANYPDCTPGFITAQQATIQIALNDEMVIRTPLIDMKKSESIILALTMPGCYRALAYSHTAYDGSYPPKGDDHASVLRAHGFEQAGVADPLILRAQWEMGYKLPMTSNYDIFRELRDHHHAMPDYLMEAEEIAAEIVGEVKVKKPPAPSAKAPAKKAPVKKAKKNAKTKR